MGEDIPILKHCWCRRKSNALTTAGSPGVLFEKVKGRVRRQGAAASLISSGRARPAFSNANDVLVAIGQENAFSMDRGGRRRRVSTNGGACPSSTSRNVPEHPNPRSSSAGDARLWPQEHHLGRRPTAMTPRSPSTRCFLGENPKSAPAPGRQTIVSQKMGNPRVELRQCSEPSTTALKSRTAPKQKR